MGLVENNRFPLVLSHCLWQNPPLSPLVTVSTLFARCECANNYYSTCIRIFSDISLPSLAFFLLVVRPPSSFWYANIFASPSPPTILTDSSHFLLAAYVRADLRNNFRNKVLCPASPFHFLSFAFFSEKKEGKKASLFSPRVPF